jgi:hypothetical protein
MVLTKAELIASLQHEIRILVHLCSKVTPQMLDYRPTPKQRSLIELLRYLTVMGPVLVPSIKAGAFLQEAWQAADAKAAGMDFEADAVAAFSDDELRAEIEMFGQKMPRGPFLVSMVQCGHAAYRTQLFCYLKSCGREELNTMNLWAGVDGAM